MSHAQEEAFLAKLETFFKIEDFDAVLEPHQVPDTSTDDKTHADHIADTISKFKSAKLDLSHCFSTKPDPIDFVLTGLKAGTVGALIGTGGVSKSMLAIIEAIHIASGCDMLGTGEINIGGVAILALEDDAQVLHHRLYSISKHLTDAQRVNAARNLHIYPITLNILDMNGAVTEALAQNCRLLIVDTLRRAHDLDENDTRQMAGVLALMERVAKSSGAAVLFVHHQGKSAITGGTTAEATSARGATVLIDNSRFCMALSAVQEKECAGLGIPVEYRRSYIRCSWPKLSYSAPMPDIILKRIEGGVLVKADVQIAVEVPKVKNKVNAYAVASRGGDSDDKDW